MLSARRSSTSQAHPREMPLQLFVRARKGEAYRACGPVYLASADDISGDRPMSINWTLKVPLPPKLFSDFSVLRG